MLKARDEQHERFAAFLDHLDIDQLPATVDVLEHGDVPPIVCLHAVLEEQFEHLRYMLRDLGRLGIS